MEIRDEIAALLEAATNTLECIAQQSARTTEAAHVAALEHASEIVLSALETFQDIDLASAEASARVAQLAEILVSAHSTCREVKAALDGGVSSPAA